MSIVGKLIGAIKNMFKEAAKSKFGVEPVISSAMTGAADEWMNIYRGMPSWAHDEIKTINMAKTICSETARLVCLDIGINISGSGARAKYLQEQIDKTLMPRLRAFVEYGCAGGTVIFKPNRHGIDIVTPDRFMVTEYDSNKKITAGIFQDTYTEGKDYLTKLEYQHFVEKQYAIETKTFSSRSESSIGSQIPIERTIWAGIDPEVYIRPKNAGGAINNPLYGVFTMPEANNIDLDSPLGMAIFANAIEELADLDVAYSRNTEEIKDSNTIELIDEALLHKEGKRGKLRTLPSHVHNVFGNGVDSFYQQIDRPLKTEQRIAGINNLLSFIGYKCGFSEGYFVLDRKTGLVTATQVEADDRRTIQLIKDIRDNLKIAIEDTVYAMDRLADLYKETPAGTYKIDFDFGDITYNEDEDRNRWYQLMMQGLVPKWYYLMKYEGLGEDEAKALVDEADQATASRTALFAEAQNAGA